MACCPPGERRDAGYATAAAMVFALALSILAAAMVARSVMLLRLARADLARTQAELALDGAQLRAAAEVIRAGAGGPFHWAMSTDAGSLDVLAEPEADKLAAERSDALPDRVLEALEVTDGDALRARLQAAAGQAGQLEVEALDGARLWRACGASVVSGLGRATDYAHRASEAPGEAGLKPAAWRVGELWRMRVTTAAGWRDDRIVRFSGDARRPVAVVYRRLSRSDGGQERCDGVLAAAG